jgi:hypothetical protein
MKKTIIFITVTIGLLLAGLLILSLYTSNKIEQSLRQAIQANTGGQYEVQFESASVNTINSTIRINNLRMYDRASRSQANFSVLTFNMPHSELLKASRTPRANMLEVVETTNMTFRNAIFYNEETGANLKIHNGIIGIEGVLGDFMRSVSLLQAPARRQRLNLNITGVEFTRDSEPGNLSGRVNSLFFVETIRGAVNYSPESRNAEFKDFRIITTGVNTDVKGTFHFGEVSDETGKEDIEINATLTSRTSRGRIDFGSDNAGVDFRRVVTTITGTIPDHRNMEEIALKNDWVVELSADQLQIYTPASFRQGTGRALGMLGASTDSFLIPSVNGYFRFMDQKVHVDRLALETPFAGINGSGKLLIDREDFNKSNWEDASIVIKPESRENFQFINSFAGFMGIRLPQDGDGFRIPVKGTIANPEIGLN